MHERSMGVSEKESRYYHLTEKYLPGNVEAPSPTQ
jgi:hypothetical protein